MNKDAGLPQQKSAWLNLYKKKYSETLEAQSQEKDETGVKKEWRGQRRVQQVASSCPDLTFQFLWGLTGSAAVNLD